MSRRLSLAEYEAIFAKEPAKRSYAESLSVSCSIRETARLVLDRFETEWVYRYKGYCDQILEDALTEAFERGQRVAEDALAEAFEGGRAAQRASTQPDEPDDCNTTSTRH